MKLEAELSLVYVNAKEAEAIAQAVTPDNLEAPAGLRVRTVRRECCICAQVWCEKSLETFIATLDDLLDSVSVAEKALDSAKSSLSADNCLITEA
jgi:hypothetical protein